MAEALKFLAIHGLGDHRQSAWKRDWQDALRAAVPPTPGVERRFSFFEYDRLFADLSISFADSLRAIYKLAASGVGHWAESTPAEGRFGLARAEGVFDEARDKLRWTAGYVVAWVENEAFRAELRRQLLDRIAEERPDVLLAHSLGSLVAYDALVGDEAAGRTELRDWLRERVTFISCGSQIGNPFVIGNLHSGRILPLPVRFWYHLYNSEDDVFTSPVSLPGTPNFRQINTFFDIPGWLDHDAVQYFKHTATVQNVWRPLADDSAGDVDSPQARQRIVARNEATEEREWRRSSSRPVRGPARKALLVGVADYPDPRYRLYGCVNDVFRMSALLQERGFAADDIRVVVNQRATAAGIRSRLEWLLEDALPNDRLVFYYSGHGAQMPSYNSEEQIDHLDEALVPYDFDWTPERAVLDDQIYRLYSQLHYDTRLTMIFDCCHSGGIHRDHGPMIRGLAPPDDIRHRALEWDPQLELWKPRPFALGAPDDRPWWTRTDVRALGRAMALRAPSVDRDERYVASRRTAERLDRSLDARSGHAPYLPTILQACREDEYAYEYRHGVESFGAFTYMLTSELRREKPNAPRSLEQLLDAVRRSLASAGRNQRPQGCAPPAVAAPLL